MKSGEVKAPTWGDQRQLGTLVMVFLLWGLANSLNHMLVHQSMNIYGLSRLRASWLQPAYYFGYVGAALPAAALVRSRGPKTALLLGLGLFALASGLIGEVSTSGRFLYLLPPMFLLAVGVSVLESTAGPYVLTSAPGGQGVMRLCLAQAFNSLGLVGGAVLGTFAVFTEQGSGHVDVPLAAHRAARPFALFVLLALLLLAAVWRQPFRAAVSGKVAERTTLLGPLRSRRFCFALFTAFIYMGVQTCTWSFQLQYLRQYAAQSDRRAGMCLIVSMGLFAIGRFVQAFGMRKAEPAKVLVAAATLGFFCAGLGVCLPGNVGAIAFVSSSLFLSVMYPMLFALAVQPMGTEAQAAGSLMVFSLLAGGLLPPLMALLAQATGSYATAYLIPCAGYVWIAFFAMQRVKQPQVIRKPRTV